MHSSRFPNMEVMAHQFLGCPATSATVKRQFSVLGMSYSDKRKSSHSDTLQIH